MTPKLPLPALPPALVTVTKPTGGRPKGVPTLGSFAAARNPGTDGAAYDAEYAKRMPDELY
jgi:hypothetical protein